MMQVKIDDNTLANFPDGTDEDDVKQAIFNYLNKPRSAYESAGEALQRGDGGISEYKPTMSEGAARLISDALYESGLISDRYGANRIGENLGMGVEALPVIGDAIGGDDLGRALAGGDATDIGIASIGAIPVAGDMLGAIIPAIMKKRKGADYNYDDILDVLNSDSNLDLSTLELDPNKIDVSQAGELQTSKGYEPQETVKAYKLFRTDDEGNIYPLFVNKDKKVERGVWVDAEAGEIADAGTKRKSAKTASDKKMVKSSLGNLAYRAGWHAGTSPAATHIGGKATKTPLAGGATTKDGKPKAVPQYRPANQVWAEVEMPNDVDWQTEALKRAERTKAGTVNVGSAEIKDVIPYGGFYKYKTNPNMAGQWMISGNQRVGRTIPQDEIMRISEQGGVQDLPLLPDFLDQHPELQMKDLTASAVKELKKYYPDYYQARFVDGVKPKPTTQQQLAGDVTAEIERPDLTEQAANISARTGVNVMPDDVIADDIADAASQIDIDQIVGEAPIVDPQDLVGLKIAPTFADLTGAGRAYEGIDSSKIDEPIELQGGADFPMLQSYNDNNIVWAANDKGAIKKLQKGDLISVNAMALDAHKSNATVNQAYLSTLEAYVRDGRLDKDALNDLDRQVAEIFPDAPKHGNLKAHHDWVESLTFDKRSKLMSIYKKKENLKKGVPNFQRILNATIDKKFAGTNLGDSMLLIRVDKGDDAVMELGKDGTKKHRSYKYGIKGEVVGRFAKPVGMKTLFSDFEAQRVAKGGDPTKTFRSLDWSRPEEVFTQEKADKIGIEGFSAIETPRQAQLADAFINNSWRTSDVAKKEGGIAPQEFIDAMHESEASPSLSKYDPEILKQYDDKALTLPQRIKRGEVKIYQLGDDSKIFFGLDNTYDYASSYPDYADQIRKAGINPQEKTIIGVVNNELGARGVGGTAVMFKAIEDGATALDAFAVPSKKFPKGFLPELYGQYGFVEKTRIPFEEKYYDKNALADLKDYWRSTGWDESMGLPDVAIMKFEGDENARKQFKQKWLTSITAGDESSIIGRATEQFISEADELVQGASSAETSGIRSGNNARNNSGSVRDSNGIPSAKRLGNVVREVQGLTDEERLSLGMKPKYQIE